MTNILILILGIIIGLIIAMTQAQVQINSIEYMTRSPLW